MAALKTCHDLNLFKKWEDCGGGPKDVNELVKLVGIDPLLLGEVSGPPLDNQHNHLPSVCRPPTSTPRVNSNHRRSLNQHICTYKIFFGTGKAWSW